MFGDDLERLAAIRPGAEPELGIPQMVNLNTGQNSAERCFGLK